MASFQYRRGGEGGVTEAVASVFGPFLRVPRQVFVSQFTLKAFVELRAFASQSGPRDAASNLSRIASCTARLRLGNTRSATIRSS